MIEKRRKLLQIPQGTESFQMEEAYKHRRLVSSLEGLYTGWGYLPVQIPVFDFFDIYQPLLDSDTLDRIYRLIDREGDLLMLRSDATLFLAKLMGRTLTTEDLPARVCYSDTILRHQDSEDIQKNEFFQTGIELIGKEGIEADLEVVLLLQKVFETVQIKEVTIHLGSRALFTSLFPSLPAIDRTGLIHAVAYRDTALQGKILADNGFPPESIEGIIELFQFIGTGDEFEEQKQSWLGKPFFNKKAADAINYITSVREMLNALGKTDNIRIDLSEIGFQPYYTGLVFQAYIPDADSAVASGGRYDNLLDFFGFPAPSIGFSVMLRKLEPFIEIDEIAPVSQQIVHIKEKDFIASYTKAEALREEGRIVSL